MEAYPFPIKEIKRCQIHTTTIPALHGTKKSASRSDTSKKLITTKNTTMNELFLVAAILGVACYFLLDHYERKQARKEWKRYEGRTKTDD